MKIKGGTMKIKFILAAMLALGSLSYSAEATDAVAQEVINEVRNIEAEYQALMQKEADEYKKLLKRFDEYYNKLEQKIADKEQQILELTKLLEVLN